MIFLLIRLCMDIMCQWLQIRIKLYRIDYSQFQLFSAFCFTHMFAWKKLGILDFRINRIRSLPFCTSEDWRPIICEYFGWNFPNFVINSQGLVRNISGKPIKGSTRKFKNVTSNFHKERIFQKCSLIALKIFFCVWSPQTKKTKKQLHIYQ
eukprot:UN01004